MSRISMSSIVRESARPGQASAPGAALSRRALLRAGAGVTVGLPFLEAMIGKQASAAPGAKRLVVMFVPNGKHMPFWLPSDTGFGYTLSPTLAQMAKFKGKMSVLSGLDNRAADTREPGDHARGTGCFLTCTTIPRDGTVSNGVSIDQVAAAQLGAQTRIKSMQLGLRDDAGDQGYAATYVRNISYGGGNRVLPKTIDPQAAFDQLFASGAFSGMPGVGPDPAIDLARRRKLQKSVLDYVRVQATALGVRLGASDRAKLDQYLSSVRELEASIQQTPVSAPAIASCGVVARPGPRPGDVPTHAKMMMDLLVLALQCDATRVVTFMLGNGGDGGLSFPFLNISSSHHPLAHHMRLQENYDKLKIIDRWEVSQLLYLVERMEAISEGTGTLLDSSLVYYSSEIADGNAHAHRNLPVAVVGSAGGVFKTGSHINYNGQPIADLYIAMLNALGVPTTTFGLDGTKPSSGLI